jgi:mannosyltransferase
MLRRAYNYILNEDRPVWPWLVALMLFAATISIGLLSRQSLRLDEAQSLWQVSHTPSKLLYLVAQDVHVPLYHLLLYIWTIAFGNGVATARLMSLIFFMATIPLVYILGKDNFNRRVGLTAAVLLTLSPFMNWYGSEARMYTLLTLMTVLNQIFFMRAWKRGGAWWFAYGASAVVGSYSHYFFLLVLATQGIFYLTRIRTFPKGTFWKLAAVMTAVVAGLTPWLTYVVHLGSASGTKPMLTSPTTVDLFNTFSQFLFGFQDDHVNTFIVSLWPLTVLLAFLTLQTKRKIDSTSLYFAYGAAFPVIFAFAFSTLIHPFYISRYLIVALPALYVFLGWLITGYTRKVRIFIEAVFLIGMAITLGQEITSPATPVKEDYSAAVSYLNTYAKPQDTVLVSAPFTIYPVEYYYTGSASLATLPLWNRFESGSAPSFSAATLPAEVKAQTADHNHTWLLLSYNQGYERDIKSYFDNHYPLLYKHVYSTDLTLYEYKTRYDPAVPLIPLSTTQTP